MRCRLQILHTVLAVTLLACSGGGSRSTDSPVLPAAEAPSVITIPREPNFSVVTKDHIDATDPEARINLIGDGSTNNTAELKRLLGNGNRHVRVPIGDYVIDSLRIPPNTILELAPGTILRDSGVRGLGDPLLSIRDADIHIVAHGATLLSDRTDYPDGEYRHGVSIVGARRVIIEGLESSGHAGDGFYIGGSDPAAEDIVLRGCRADNNKRQGLSIISARRVYIVDSEFSNTLGTPPEAGIDLEPNYVTDVLDQITIVRPQTTNNHGGGIRIELSGMTAGSEPATVTILEHTSRNEQPPYELRNRQGAPITVDYRPARP